MGAYTEHFYQGQSDGSRRSAKVLVPLVLELLEPRRVIDVGCGVGTWLSVFEAHGIEDVWGVDGDYVPKGRLEISAERFLPHDLRRPLRLDGRFDLVVSLEVAEHLPSECAETFVDSLTGLGPVVLFSAAIPHQGGTHHVNEQWPDYWADRFERRGHVVIDCLRRKIWQNEDVEWWYAQNTLLFVERAYLGAHPSLKNEYDRSGASPLSIVHPRKYLSVIEASRRLDRARRAVETVIPAGERFLLVDQAQFGADFTVGRRTVPFLEHDGRYWGPPPDDATAIRELERLREGGASFMVFAWPAFWWLDYYAGLRRHLRSQARGVLENDDVVVFDLRVRP